MGSIYLFPLPGQALPAWAEAWNRDFEANGLAPALGQHDFEEYPGEATSRRLDPRGFNLGRR